MKNFIKIIPCLVLFLSGVNAQTSTYTFKHLSVEDGLSQSTVFCILQDVRGYMWFGTTDGLNKYDGYKFTVYNNEPSDSTSISGNGITAIYQDSDGTLWIGTSEGILNRYDRKTDTFNHFVLESSAKRLAVFDNSFYSYPLVYSRNVNKTITALVEDSRKNLWIGTWGDGIYYFEKNSGKLIHYFNIDDDTTSISSNRITGIVKDKDDEIWIGTFGGGLNRLTYSIDSTGNSVKFIRYKHSDNNDKTISDDEIMSVYVDQQNVLWIGTFRGGLNKLDASQKMVSPSDIYFMKYNFDPDNPGSLSANIVTSIVEDKQGILWVGTFGRGLNRFIPETDSFISYRNDPFDDKSISDNDILSLFVDRSGILWIGTHLGRGISKLEKHSIKFGLINKQHNDRNSINDDVIWSIYEDADSILWIGTYRGGLNRYDKTLNKFNAFKNNPDDPNSISSNHVRAIKEDKYGNLWIGTFDGGLNRFNKTTEKFTSFIHDPLNPRSIGANQIQHIYIDDDNKCWIGAFGGGLNYFDLEKYHDSDTIIFRKFTEDINNTSSISDNRVYVIIPEDRDNLWIGTYGGGINKFNKRTGKFISYEFDRSDPSFFTDNRILTLFKDSEKNFWIGTNGGGLIKFDEKNQLFVHYGTSKGFNSQVVYGILEDSNKNLWISSDNGILKYSLLTNNITSYDLKDGLQSMEFSGGAYFKNVSGEMYFGGISGLNYFYPDSVRSNITVPPIVISEFKIFNESIKGEIDKIKVSYDQNFFTIGYAALDYTDPMNNQYAHYLEGFENDWNYSSAQIRRAYYTNIEPGTYTFRVKASNSDGIWNSDGISVIVQILPPFWKTWWFILISIFLIGGIVSFLISMKVKHLLAMEKLKVRLAADLHDNVGAGLTEISILSELSAKEIGSVSPGVVRKLDTVSDIARQLVDSMSDIVWFVNPKRDSLHDLIIRLKDSYSDLLSELGVSFKTNNIENIRDIKLPMDVRQNLYLIFKEGINNSIKHSKCRKLNLESRIRGNILELVLQDDGIGIEPGNGSHGNGLRNMKERARSLGGELKIESELNRGTKISYFGKIDSRSMFKFIWS